MLIKKYGSDLFTSRNDTIKALEPVIQKALVFLIPDMFVNYVLCSQFLALLLANAIIAQGTEDEEIEPRIVGGHLSNIRNMKYVVQVTTKDILCGGSLITTRWVITAAHCVHRVNVNDLLVYGGTSIQQGRNGIKRLVNLVVVPPGFNINTMNMDVAALYLNQEMVGDRVTTIPLASQQVPPRRLVQVSGWGTLTPNSEETARHLHSVLVPVWSYAACQAAYRGIKHITLSMVCASKPFKRDSCDGDSGGPMVAQGELVGIVSFGTGCADRQPGVYTSIPFVRRWILNTIARYS